MDNVGQGNFKECESFEFEEIAESGGKENDFYLEEEEENVPSIKAA